MDNRIGYAMTKPAGPANRQSEYGIYRVGEGAPLYARYEGCRYDSAKGQVEVGLPLAGPLASHNQPLIDFRLEHYELVQFFNAEDAVGPAIALLKLEIPALASWPEGDLRQTLWSTSPSMSAEAARAQARFRSILKTLVSGAV